MSAKAVSGQQTGLVDAVRAAESALDQARSLLDAVDSAAGDIRHAVATMPSVLADIQAGIQHANEQLQKSPANKSAYAAELIAARDAAARAVDNARVTGAADPLSAFAQLTTADADLDRLLAAIAQEQANAETSDVHSNRHCSRPSRGYARSRTTSIPVAAVSGRKPGPGWPRPDVDSTPHRATDRPIRPKRSPRPTRPRRWPRTRSRWPIPTCRPPSAPTRARAAAIPAQSLATSSLATSSAEACAVVSAGGAPPRSAAPRARPATHPAAASWAAAGGSSAHAPSQRNRLDRLGVLRTTGTIRHREHQAQKCARPRAGTGYPYMDVHIFGRAGAPASGAPPRTETSPDLSGPAGTDGAVRLRHVLAGGLNLLAVRVGLLVDHLEVATQLADELLASHRTGATPEVAGGQHIANDGLVLGLQRSGLCADEGAVGVDIAELVVNCH
ncbi:hypothetical protein I551_2350 [Mycobacterium ulcerans str. Harvey]|uniref:Uncharacterized protein n=1 Tax=Mycobacterium ulcerans str. Harvey TaxID=1299332 RepID=A0ABN0R346_MYCUL|nr:hypothetical protein I551_2350 [Mycobacterium ulcerans str. Harvey]